MPIPNRTHESRTRVRYQETDQMGVVYHSNYLIYFEIGRTEFLRSQGLTYRELEEQGIFLAVIHAEAQFRSSARYDDPLLIRTWVMDRGPASLRFGYQVLQEKEQRICAEGSTELACLDEQKKPRKLPPQLLSFLKSQQ